MIALFPPEAQSAQTHPVATTKTNRPKKRFRSGLIIGIGVVVVAIVAFLAIGADSTAHIVHYTVDSNKLNQGESIHIVQVSDLHSSAYGVDQNELIDDISSQHPDIIVLTGDIFDSWKDPKPAYEFASQVGKIAPTYYVTGNHEMRRDDTERILRTLEAEGITVLKDTSVEVAIPRSQKHLILAGIDDPSIIRYKYQGDRVAKRTQEQKRETHLDSLFSSIAQSDEPTVLLAHHPEEYKKYESWGFDLVFSGHAHGGQIRIPGVLDQGLYAPNQGLFPKRTGGLFRDGNMTQVVSCGLAKDTFMPRAFDPLQLVVVDLVGVH